MKTLTKQRQNSLGYRIGRLFRLNSCLLDKWLAHLGIGHGQIPYVLGTNEIPGQTQDDIANSIRVNRAATARTLKNMEKADLVTREENPENRRQKLVFPTDKSRALVDDLLPILANHNTTMFEGFSDQERTQAIEYLDRIIGNVENALHKDEE